MKLAIADVRVVLADIPVRRPHTMSFTTLEAVNFAFVRIATHDGLVGWGEAACLGGPTWSEESSESVAATVTRMETTGEPSCRTSSNSSPGTPSP